MNGMRGRHPRVGLQPCGTPAAWRRHHARGEYPCLPCADAWAASTGAGHRRTREREARRLERERLAREHDALYQAALAGIEPAEALTTTARAHLLCELHAWRWSDVQIAEHTRMTLYTTVRIRERLGLPSNPRARLDLDEMPAASRHRTGTLGATA